MSRSPAALGLFHRAGQAAAEGAGTAANAVPAPARPGPARTQPVAHQPAVVVGHLEAGLALDGDREVLHGGGELHAQVPHLPAVVERRGEVAAGAAGTEEAALAGPARRARPAVPGPGVTPRGCGR